MRIEIKNLKEKNINGKKETIEGRMQWKKERKKKEKGKRKMEWSRLYNNEN